MCCMSFELQTITYHLFLEGLCLNNVEKNELT